MEQGALDTQAGTSQVGGAEPTEDRPELQRKLAEANLMRVRCRWIDAEAKCVEVLRADPNDINAHSLLGDIYRDQGRLDDARQWYQMVLDLCPGSQADREKLARVEQALRDAERQGESGGRRARRWMTPTNLLRAATAVVLLFLLFAGAAAMYMGGTRSAPRRRASRPPVPTSLRTNAPPTTSLPADIPSVPTINWEDRWTREASIHERLVAAIPSGAAIVSAVSVAGLPACAEVHLIWIGQTDPAGAQATIEHCVLQAARSILAELPEARGVVVRVGWLGNRGVEPLVVALATRGAAGDLSALNLGPIRWLGRLPDTTQPQSQANPAEPGGQVAPPNSR